MAAPSRGPRGARKDQNPRRKKRIYHRRKVCRFCADSSLVITYKDPKSLRYFITERGKQARTIAFLPFVGSVDLR